MIHATQNGNESILVRKCAVQNHYTSVAPVRRLMRMMFGENLFRTCDSSSAYANEPCSQATEKASCTQQCTGGWVSKSLGYAT